MSAVKEERQAIKLYKKSDLCRSEWILTQDFDLHKEKFIPIEYQTPSNKKYSKNWVGVRYVKLSDLNEFIRTYFIPD